jgi:iron(III) transport system permease protein
MRSLQREPVLLLALLAAIALVLAFIVYPQIQVVLVPGADGYVSFLQGGTWTLPLTNSVKITLLSTTTSVLLGFVFAYAMVYTPMPWKPLFRVIGILPLLSPPFVVAAVYILLFGPRGIVSYGVFGQSPSVFGLLGVWGVQTIAFFPFAYQLIADVLSRSDARLEQAARNLGAGPWQVFRSVTLPLSGPGLGAAILTCAIYILEDFGNPQLIGGGFNVLPTQAYSLIEGFGDFTGAAAVSTILLLLALSLYFAKTSLDRGRSFVTVGGKASSMPRPPVPPMLTRACFIACLALAGLILLVYGTLIVSALTLYFPTNLNFTTIHFAYLGAHATSLQNSFVYSMLAAIGCSIFALFAGFMVQRGTWPGRKIFDFLLIMPAAIPGIFFGIGYLTAFNQPWSDQLAGFFGQPDLRAQLIVIALLFWNIPVAYQAITVGLRQIDKSIDEAATSLGASSLRGFRDVLVPMLGGSVQVGFVTTFVRAVTTLSVVIFLFTPRSTTATITIFQLVNDFDWGGAAAFTVGDVGIAIIVLVLIQRLGGRLAVTGFRGG